LEDATDFVKGKRAGCARHLNGETGHVEGREEGASRRVGWSPSWIKGAELEQKDFDIKC